MVLFGVEREDAAAGREEKKEESSEGKERGTS